MSWFDKRETRPAYRSYPDGRDWRCPARVEASAGAAHVVHECGFTEPEDARPTETTCPACGTGLVRTVADFNVVQEPA